MKVNFSAQDVCDRVETDIEALFEDPTVSHKGDDLSTNVWKYRNNIKDCRTYRDQGSTYWYLLSLYKSKANQIYFILSTKTRTENKICFKRILIKARPEYDFQSYL